MHERLRERIAQRVASVEAGFTEVIATTDDPVVRAVALLRRAAARHQFAAMLPGGDPALAAAAVADYAAAIPIARASDHEPVVIEALTNLVTTLGHAGRFAEARRVATDALELLPAEDPTRRAARHYLLRNRGTSAFFVGDHEAATADYRAALTLAPEQAGVWSDLGEALVELGRHEEAIAAFERAREAGCATSLTFVGRGTARARLGDLEGAREDFTLVLEHEPGNAAAQAGLARLDPVMQ